jgi:hypothetical protein
MRAVRPLDRPDPQQDVGREERAEEHDFEARKSQMPILPLVRPVSGRGSTVYGSPSSS